MDQAGWDGLSALLQGAPPWREELNHRWEGREDWQAFVEWEKEFKATREREVEELVKMVVDRLTGKTDSESWSELSPAREEQIKQNIQYFEDLLMKPNQAGWARLSDIAGGWRVLLDRLWADRPDWKAFIAWESERRAAMERKIQVHAKNWHAYVEMLDDDRALVDWCRAGGELVRGIAVRRGDEWVWSDEFQDSPVHQAVPVEGLSTVIEVALRVMDWE